MVGCRWNRAVAALFAVWLAFVLGEPAMLHACPKHDVRHRADASGAMAGAMDAHAAHERDADHAGGTGAPAPSGGHQCTCLGDCGAAVTALLPMRVASVVPAPAFVRNARPHWPVAYLPVAADFVLPFANGPPAVAHRG